MDEAELRRRALEADRLMREPLLVEALDLQEQAAIEELLRTNGWMPWADRKRCTLIDRVNAIRALRRNLRTTISLGTVEEKPKRWA